MSANAVLKTSARRSPAVVAAFAAVAAAILAVLVARYSAVTVLVYLVAAAFAASFVYVIVRADPVYTFTGALLLGTLSGNYEGVGLPGILAPNRIVLGLAALAVLLRLGPSRTRLRLRPQPVHWLMLAAGVYVVVSAALAQHLVSKDSIADLAERFGLLPMLAFFAAPAAFRSERERSVLLVALVGLGTYLGATALFETAGLDALVFPPYINDPNYGILVERARGPFADPIANGMALFTCAGASVIALGTWRSGLARLFAGTTALLCLAGVLFTLTRGVWLGALVATAVMLVVVPALRRRTPLVLAAGALTIGVALVAVPGLSEKVTERGATQGTVYDRYALNRGAINMFEEKPLLGWGWYTWRDQNVNFLEQGDDWPLPEDVAKLPVHNLYLGFLAELGLIGTGLWLAALALGVGGAILRRTDEHMRPWRYLVLAVAIFYLSISNFAPTTTFPVLILLFLAGVVNGGSPRWAFEAEPPRRLSAER